MKGTKNHFHMKGLAVRHVELKGKLNYQKARRTYFTHWFQEPARPFQVDKNDGTATSSLLPRYTGMDLCSWSAMWTGDYNG